ncbi:hypothetical protein BM535_21675 [Clostridioides difficile]|nr:hypothetical protein BM535_21675 [Clostridioides difficile]
MGFINRSGLNESSVQLKNKKEYRVRLKRYFRNKGKIRDLTLITLGLNTGFRIEDILKLRVKDVYKKREINIKESKTGKRIRKPIMIV